MRSFRYSLVIEATNDPQFFGFYSPELEGFTGVADSVDDCSEKASVAMKEHVKLLAEQGLPIPPSNPHAKVTIEPANKVCPAA